MNCQKILLSLIATLAIATTFAQPICGFDKLHATLLRDDTAYRNRMLLNEAHIKEYIRKHPVSNLGNLKESSVNVALYTIPVVVHVVHTGGAVGTTYNPGDAQIQGAIDYLNQVYNGSYPGTQGVGDLQVQFVMAARDTNCNPFNGIDRIDGSSLTNYASNGVNYSNSGGISDATLKNFDRWDPANYYNIWVVNKIDAKDGTSGQFIAGYAFFAGASTAVDGTVMLATQMATGKKTLPHEIGHALNLFHPFEGSPDAATCPANADCNTDGDGVCDTDPITYNQTAGVVDFTCRSGTNACTGTAYSINTEKNYMNYTSCYTLFTAGQKARMLAAMSLPGRASLVSSSAIGVYPLSPYVPPPAASCSPVTNATGLGGYYAGIMGVSIASKSFSSGASRDDGGYVDKTVKCLYLTQMQRNNTYSFSASLLGANREQLRIWIDYNNDGIFSNATEQIYYAADIANPGGGTYATVSTNFTIPATAATGTVLRMRVLEEVSTVYNGGLYTINSACYNPVYGQAEDYPVILSALLPVKLEAFAADRKDADGLVTWKTSFEQNAKEFRVEKSSDGDAFSLAGIVVASNNSNGATYTFTDKNIGTAKLYYRLKQVDMDEKITYSKIVAIAAQQKTGGTRVLTNPFTDGIDMVFSKPVPGNVVIRLLDVTGKEVYHSILPAAGQTRIRINMAAGKHISAGMYLLQVSNGQEQFVEKVIKQQ